MTGDVELLRLEIDTLWTSDERGRLVEARREDRRQAPHLVVAAGGDGCVVAVGQHVPDAVAAAVEAAVAAGPPPEDREERTSSIDECERLLAEAVGGVVVSSGPGYVIPPGTRFESSARVRTSADPDVPALHDPPPVWGWTSVEWDRLLEGRLAPWAMAFVDGRVASLCHSARFTDRGAEAGLWTDPPFRGQGHGAAATAAWASLPALGQRVRFYSTSTDNLSSQAVAARLGLRRIGWMWTFSSPDAAAG